MAERIAILGGGIAGVTCAEQLRKQGSEAEITIVEREELPLYSRVLLPHYIKGKVPRERVFMRSLEWYAENDIEYLSGTEFTKIDTASKFVEVTGGRELPYDKLVIATGGDVRMLPHAPARGIEYFRTLSDSDGILASVKALQGREDAHALCYGGGFLAMELVNIFAKYEVPFTVAMRGSGFWSKQLMPALHEVLAKQIAEHGGGLRTNVDAVEFVLEHNELTGASLDGEFLDVQFAGIGIGIEQDMHCFKAAGLDLGACLRSNEYLETNIEDVYAIGDGAEFFDLFAGRHIVTGNWMNAQMQGRHLGKRLATGERKAFELVSSYATNLLGKEIVFIGDTSIQAADNVLEYVQGGEARQLFERGGKTVGAILIENTKERAAITQAIKEQTKYASKA
jgi:NAD(P)H-nitrite reductase large subunit